MDIRTFFGQGAGQGNGNIIRPESARHQLFDTQNRLLNLYNSSERMSHEQLERAIDGIVGSTREMVRRRIAENPPGINILNRLLAVRDRTLAEQDTRPQTPNQSTVPILPAATNQPAAQLRPAARPTATPAAPAPFDWSLPQHSSTKKKLKVIAKAKFNGDCEQECGICFEIHKKRDTLTTSCDHVYCISCWSTWMNARNSNKTCPTCRLFLPSATYYKIRATKKRETLPVLAQAV
jgi:hypothetical protein